MRLWLFILLAFLIGCTENKPERPEQVAEKPKISVPSFDAENAFRYLEAQVSFGPRVPNTNAHKQCLDYLNIELQKYADEVKLQNFNDDAYGKNLSLTNVIASFNKNSEKRILFAAHWDTHPWADQDLDPKNHDKPIDGANDGASGVAVLIEVARILKNNPPPIGVDIILFDGEDYAKPTDVPAYLRGSKYFAKNKPANYNPMFGILLDMIGDAQLEIPKESYSLRYAPDIIKLVWSIAKDLNLPEFVDEPGLEIIDDHLPLNEVGIKTINLIDFNYPDDSNRYWHTMDDTPDKCSPRSFEVVGKVLLNVIYRNY